MEVFKKIMSVINRVFSPFCLGFAMHDLFTGDYKNAAWVLFVVSIFFMVGYYAERLSRLKEDF